MAPAASPLTELIETTRAELEQVQSEFKEISRMVDQSRGEVEKLAQRNAAITAHLRQVQGNLENLPRSDIKTAYEAAQDSQQRLFTMRGQLEKFQGDQTHLERQVNQLRKVLTTLQTLGGGEAAEEGTPTIVKVVEAQEAERQRLSRQMHDGPAQALSNFILQAEIAMRLFEIDPERARTELQALKASATSTFQKIRDFIFDLRPMMLDDLGLAPTVKRYVDAFKEKTGVQTTLTVTGTDRRLESVREVMVFRGIQELLGNVRNHAQATQARVMLDVDDNRVRAVVEDNGKGFDVSTTFNGKQKTIGLSTLKERMDSLGGQLQIESQIGQGTRVVLEVPAGVL
jgi:two-component system sensor histidine kinase DegS